MYLGVKMLSVLVPLVVFRSYVADGSYTDIGNFLVIEHIAHSLCYNANNTSAFKSVFTHPTAWVRKMVKHYRYRYTLICIGDNCAIAA